MYRHGMTIKSFFLKKVLMGLLILGCVLPFLGDALAADMPSAAGSPIAGITFDDRPLMLPVQRNFQMAMLTASSEMGRSCGRMEAYGWRLSGEEQQRVNQIFNNTVDRLRAQGYVVETKSASSVSRDVTLFSADRSDKHLILMWSAGEIGLVMVLCETSEPLTPIPEYQVKKAENLQPAAFPTPLELTKKAAPSARASATASPSAPSRLTRTGKTVQESFSPVGAWVGTYTCGQGTTGATLSIEKLKGDQFEGVFSFYPTAKNPYVAKGKYRVFGEYDADSLRILVNPGKWIERPKDYYSTIMIGSFDPIAGTFSAFFQGIMGCTSFEAHAGQGDSELAAPSMKKNAVEKKPAAKAVKKKKAAAKPAAAAATTTESAASLEATRPTETPRASSIEPAAGISVTTPTKSGM